ncbi:MULTISPECIES: YggT family protein [Asaia]|uniref:YggT family protein n=1 Tax=Asaia siamensis TaxID=110479 RepID=A0ABQ1MDW5_9PROT|nr:MULTISPECIES: YggT family protein [Asaia]GBR03751.1 hypothetical protein AA0323_0424 [Asaia siamensis NRIC 0323]GBR12691.1 hypothetical protein AA105894_0600 [Asaia spathodeae NBRC 105894]GGC38876.1 hypothetical protein GCM10007207_25460 [Asaia siamensis]
MLILTLYKIIMMLIQVFTWALVLYCVMSMLLGFRILDPSNRFVYNVAVFLGRIVEPVLNPVRSILPQFGMLDLSPLAVLLALQYLVVPALRQLVMLSLQSHY